MTIALGICVALLILVLVGFAVGAGINYIREMGLSGSALDRLIGWGGGAFYILIGLTFLFGTLSLFARYREAIQKQSTRVEVKP